jgi:hypothetical protein
VRPVEEFDLTVALDYGQFHLSGLPMHDGGTDALVRLVEEAATLQRVTIPVPSGRYAARVTGRGFLNHGWPGVHHARRRVATPALAGGRPDPAAAGAELDEPG